MSFAMSPVTSFFRCLAILFAAVALLAACGEQEQGKVAPRPALTVTVVQPVSEDWPIRLLANGTVEPWQEAVVGSDVQALRLAQVLADVGDTVKAGQVLAVFDDEPVKIDVAQAKAALAQAESMMATARDDAKRARALRGSGAMSDQQVVQYLSAEQSARAQVDFAQAALAAQELRLVRTRVLSPDAGVISARSATVGAVPGPGGELFRLIRKGRLEWRAELTDVELERIAPGVAVQLTLAGGRLVDGSVRMVAPTLAARTRTGLAYVDLPANAAVRPGMFARGEFHLGMRSALTLPSQAVTMREAFSYVFRVEADASVRQVKVTTGRRIGDRVEILDGLLPEDRVVLAGAGFLNDGDLVRVVASEPSQNER
ncbi:MAG: efflux RND transporter periplasmic adaptor subunit [Proteobacteria bacterium]|nr:efflux RND transporter periplasmic adaptor subunit [Pseudomonadota bacterium]MCL2307399.1 efflux RND transporter periplasmic adaptor subunit [Pseudomonadota bacterium]